MSGDLFDGIPIDPGKPTGIPLKAARRLVERVHALEEATEHFYTRCDDLAIDARLQGAHHIARIARWLAHPDSFERYGFDGCHSTAERMADRWLERIERRYFSPRRP